MTEYSSRRDERPPPPHGQVVPEFQAKQGRRGYQVLVVLLASLALVVIAFGALYLYSARPFTAPSTTAQSRTPAPYSTP